MIKDIERQLVKLSREIQILKKKLVLQRKIKVKNVKTRLRNWERLGDKISAKWDDVSAVEEIKIQRKNSD